jgi:phosphatidylserine/phosphatidylglycerophosphate/cardiolipin synthase-like enzyme
MPSVVLRKSVLSPIGPLKIVPESVRAKAKKTSPTASNLNIFIPEMVGRNCRLSAYKKVKVPAFTVDDEIVAYCSPDSTYSVTKRLFDAAKKTILIGIYDFSAPHIVELVQNALQRGVKIKLMLDIDNEKEQDLFDELLDQGVDAVPAPSCASKRAKYFSSSHEKVIVIDDEWSLVQSGNYSSHSIPLNVVDGGDPNKFRFGNRDTGLAIRSRELAKFFSKILKRDMALELAGPQGVAKAAVAATAFLIEKAPTKVPLKLFPSKPFKLNKALEIQPVLSPDNYMSVVPDFLKGARKSILIEQQYIRGSQSEIAKLLAAVKAAMSASKKLEVRIILGKIFNKKDLPKEKKNLQLLSKQYKLKLGKNIRFVDTTRFVHCHNKMVLVDGKGVLVSSQNWSDSAVAKNREAGVILEHAGICAYYTEMFESDWKTAIKTLSGAAPESIAPQTLARGGYVRVAAADYQEV